MDGVKAMFEENKVVVYLATRNYYKYIPAAVTSLVMNSTVDKIYLCIEDNEFPCSLPKQVEIINVSSQRYFDVSCPNYNSKWTYMVLVKMTLPFLFYQYDKILYLDVDTIIDKNIDSIWDISLDGYCFGMVKEIHRSTETRNYYNAGVCLMNLKKLREDGWANKIIQALQTKKYVFCEQDCINELCPETILEISSEYNVSPFNEVPEHKRIIHFAGINDWTNRALYQKYLTEYNTMGMKKYGA